MRLEVTSTFSGHGHRRLSDALRLQLHELEPSLGVPSLNALRLMGGPAYFKSAAKVVAAKATRFIPNPVRLLEVFEAGKARMERRAGVSMCECRTESLLEFRQPGDLSEISDWWSSRKLLRHLHDEQVEVVVCATVPQARLLTFLKRRGETNVRIVVVHSDHGPYFGWGDMRHIDLIAVADPESCDAFLKRGVPAEKLCCYGIPTASHPGYFAPLEARPEVTVYLAAGGFGWGGIHRPVEQLAGLSGLKMKVVCGENPDAVRRVRAIAAKHPGQIEVHGKLSDPLPLMAECHLYIGAPGGQTMSEASNLGLGAVIPWMGKNGNSAYFKKHGAAHVIPFEELRVVVQKLLEDRDQLMSLRMNARRIARPAASEQTARRILEVLP